MLIIWLICSYSSLLLDAICYLPGDRNPYPLEQRAFNVSITEEELLQLHVRLSVQLKSMKNACGHNHYPGYTCLWFVAPRACSREHKHPMPMYEDTELHNAAIYIHNPCFTTHSWGNNFGSYVESVLCAKLSGMHLLLFFFFFFFFLTCILIYLFPPPPCCHRWSSQALITSPPCCSTPRPRLPMHPSPSTVLSQRSYTTKR